MEEKGEKKNTLHILLNSNSFSLSLLLSSLPESRERTMLQSERRRGTRLIKVKQPGVFVDFVNAHSSVLSAGFLFNNDSFGGVAVFVSGGFCLFRGEG